MKYLFSIIAICFLSIYSLEAQTTEKDQASLCDLQALRLVESSPQVQNSKMVMRDAEIVPSLLIAYSPKSNLQPKGVTIGHYSFRLGVNSSGNFETTNSYYFYPSDGRLVEIDVVTGEEIEIAYDQKMLAELKKACQ